jgi:16S rRNA (uracil1498-N3)-methyltransferase
MFYADRAALERDVVVLGGAEGRHAAVVRRLRPGERVDVGDGSGLVAECVVASQPGPDRPGPGRLGPGQPGPDRLGPGRPGGELELMVTARREVPRPEPLITVVQAIPKGDRGELAVEEMTEVGVDRIVPWAAARCVPVWRDGRGVARWRSRAREAAKQAARAWIPEVADPVSTEQAAGLAGRAAVAFVLDPAAGAPLAGAEVPPSGTVLVVIGPEGGITGEENAAFRAAGAIACRLGPSVLRTSTAGAVASAVLLSRTARWR